MAVPGGSPTFEPMPGFRDAPKPPVVAALPPKPVPEFPPNKDVVPVAVVVLFVVEPKAGLLAPNRFPPDPPKGDDVLAVAFPPKPPNPEEGVVVLVLLLLLEPKRPPPVDVEAPKAGFEAPKVVLVLEPKPPRVMDN